MDTCSYIHSRCMSTLSAAPKELENRLHSGATIVENCCYMANTVMVEVTLLLRSSEIRY